MARAMVINYGFSEIGPFSLLDPSAQSPDMIMRMMVSLAASQPVSHPSPGLPRGSARAWDGLGPRWPVAQPGPAWGCVLKAGVQVCGWQPLRVSLSIFKVNSGLLPMLPSPLTAPPCRHGLCCRPATA